MSRNNAELSNIIPFKEDDHWYLELVYKYEDKKGKHTVVIPKASIPFAQGRVPFINIDRNIPYHSQYALERPYMNCDDKMYLYESVCDIAIIRGNEQPGCFFDIITEYASREMTLDEIEKELGYKVKIINKEKKNNES